jgi:aspartate aminotransferase-like enzyme
MDALAWRSVPSIARQILARHPAMNRSIQCRIATAEWEFEQIHRLNYKTFVEEIPQHEPNAEGRLVDKFHVENTYAICVDGERVVGMVAARGNRPFSLDHKLPDLDSYLPPGRRICEIRLLSVEKEYRHGSVLRDLLATIAGHFIALGFDTTVISGTLRQQKLYRHMGFVPFGPVVGKGDALYQPMSLTLEHLRESAPILLDRGKTSSSRPPLNFLPGPVEVHPNVRGAFETAPVSHRSARFVADFQEVRTLLCKQFHARHAAILLGSGTMANDAIAAQLSLLDERGLVLSNGEFGRRLIDHARRFGLSFDVLEINWGEAFTRSSMEQAVQAAKGIGWLWAVHCETSTGMLNDLAALRNLCAAHGIKLCLDAISSLGVAPVDLRNVHFASGASGKGLGAYPGLSMVFHQVKIEPSASLPRYLDLGYWAAHGGIPFTASSNLLYALREALRQRGSLEMIFAELTALSGWLRTELRQAGFRLVGEDEEAAPALVTIELPKHCDSLAIGEELERQDVWLSYRSAYLAARNWMQICLMGECSRGKVAALLAHLHRVAPAIRAPGCSPVPG